ncbi:isochorismatase family protein, partial [Actinocrinis sp.]|uniref:isochorismatase family protein n=1 Tax=Actinocrinis sp. TaxID=1920516 RepID=UPI002C56231A
MTTLTGRPNTALLVVDVQNDIMSGVYNRDAVVANIGLLIDKARAESVPVVWVQHSGEDVPIDSEGWQF